jgi:hypothetical protein
MDQPQRLVENLRAPRATARNPATRRNLAFIIAIEAQ